MVLDKISREVLGYYEKHDRFITMLDGRLGFWYSNGATLSKLGLTNELGDGIREALNETVRKTDH